MSFTLTAWLRQTQQLFVLDN